MEATITALETVLPALSLAVSTDIIIFIIIVFTP